MLGKDTRLYLSSFKALSRFIVDKLARYEGPFPYIDGLVLRVTPQHATELRATRGAPRRALQLHAAKARSACGSTCSSTSRSCRCGIASLCGLLFAAFGFLLAVVFAIEKLRHPELPAGWASLVVTVLTVSGVQLVALGPAGRVPGPPLPQGQREPDVVVRRTLDATDRRIRAAERGALPFDPYGCRGAGRVPVWTLRASLAASALLLASPPAQAALLIALPGLAPCQMTSRCRPCPSCPAGASPARLFTGHRPFRSRSPC